MALKREVGQCIRLNLIPALLNNSWQLAGFVLLRSPAGVHPRIACLAYEDDHQASNRHVSCSHPKGGPKRRSLLPCTVSSPLPIIQQTFSTMDPET